MKPYVASHLKDMNRKKVYRLLSSVEEISKAEISRQTGISAPTVIKIMKFFIDNDFVIEVGAGESAVGRKPHILKFNPNAAFSIGAELEGDCLKVGLVNLLGEVKGLKKMHMAPELDRTVDQDLYHIVKSLINEQAIPAKKLLGLGVGIMGVLDSEKYTIQLAPLINIKDVRECKELFDSLSNRLNIPVYIENDVNAAAIGEYVTRKIQADSDLIYISLGTGFGSGMILNGRLRKGKRNIAGEIGYTVFDKDFQAKRQQAGWMENRINLAALSEKWGYSPSSDINTMPLEQFTSMIDFIASNLALCIANLSMQMDIDCFVLGGITVEAIGEPLLVVIHKYLSKLCLYDVQVQLMQCKEPTIVGMASIVTEIRLDELLSD